MDSGRRSRVEKLLGMLGSTFDGERANAARMIAGIAEQEHKTIPDMVRAALGLPSAGAHSFGFEAPPRRPPPRRDAQPSQASGILAALLDIVACEDELEFVITNWERQFAKDVSDRYDADYELSEKQVVTAQRIIDKVKKSREQGRAA